MPHVTIPDEEAEIVYLNQTGSGPFAFTFTYFDEDDIVVFVNDVALASSGWTVTPDSVATGGYIGGSITLVDNVTSAKVTIQRNARAGRASDFGVGGAKPQSVDSALDKLHAIARDIITLVNRTIQLYPGDNSGPFYVGDAATRAGKIMKFSDDGSEINLISVAAIEQLTALATELTALSTVTDEIALLGVASVITDMGLLGTASVVADMAALAEANVLAAMAAIKADIDLGGSSHILNAATNAATATAKAAEALASAIDADYAAISAGLSEDAIATILDQFGIMDGSYADVDAAVTAGGVVDDLFRRTDNTLQLITGVGPNTSLQVSPLTSAQSTILANANIGALAGLTGAANKIPYFTGAGAMANADFTSTGRSVVAAANVSAIRTLLQLVPGTDVQGQSATLDLLAAISTTSYGRAFLALADAAAARTAIGVPAVPTSSQSNPCHVIIEGSGGKIGIVAGSTSVGANSIANDTYGITFSASPYVAVSSNDSGLGTGDNVTGYPRSGFATTQIELVNGPGSPAVLSWIAIGPVA